MDTFYLSENVYIYDDKMYKDDKIISYKDWHKHLSEIGWRDFSYNLLFNYPDMTELPIQSKFLKFPWLKNNNFLNKSLLNAYT